MRKDFAQWDYTDALAALTGRQKPGDTESLAYVVEGDNWRNGDNWTGPVAKGADSQTSNVIRGGIERVFTPKGAIPSVVRRHRRGVVGREPGWVVTLRRPLGKVQNEDGELVDETPSAREQALIDEANRLLLDWWNNQRGLREFRKAVGHYLTVGRGPLRLYYPPGALQGGRMPVVPFERAVRLIFLLAPKPDEAAVVTDAWTMRKAGVYTYEDEAGKPAIGLCYVNDAGETVVRTLAAAGSSLTQQAPGLIQRAREYLNGDGGAQADPALPLSGNLLLFELDGEPLITEPVKRQQRLLDKALTMLSHNMDEAGFREEVFMNAQPPGKMVKVPDPDGSGRQIEVFMPADPSTLPKGPGAVKFIQGVPQPEYDQATNTWKTRLTTPSRQVTEPVPVTSYTDTAREAYRNILEDTDQLHVQIAGDATASGVSRQEAKDDYKKSLDETGSEVDYVGSSVMDTVLALVAIFAGKAGYFDAVRVSFQSRIDPGPLSAEDRRVNMEEVRAEIKSLEEGRQYAGSNDPDATEAKVLEEKKARMDAGLLPVGSPPPVEDKSGEGLPA